MKQPLVSIVTPVYNVDNYLSECLDSLLNQSYENLEIILIDDGSTDKSASICDEYAKNDARIQVVHQKNHGVSVARNVGLDSAKGDYLLFVDADDIALPELTEKLLEGFTSDDIGITTCGLRKFTKSHDLREVSSTTQFRTLDTEQAIKELFYGNKIGSGPFCKMLRRTGAKGIYFDKSLTIGEDLEFMTSVLLTNGGWQINHTDEPLYGYRVRKGSAMNSGYGKGDIDYLGLVVRLGREVTLKYPSTKSAIAFRTFGVASYCVGRMDVKSSKHSSELGFCNTELRGHSLSVLFNSRTSLRDRCLAFAYMIHAGLASRLRHIT
jgi:glycosyltransferase involved in cell wall biosynthesis